MDILNNKAWLLVEILETKDNRHIVQSELFDGTKFQISLHPGNVDPLKDDPKKGWILVDYNGESNGRVAITLPAPILNIGHEISVKSTWINKYKKVGM